MLSVQKPHIVADFVRKAAQGGKTVGFVPTMGAIHPGHISLIQRSTAENDLTICSIFVNPRQFNDRKDLEHYPRPIERDMELLHDAGLDLLFLPGEKDIYPPGYSAPHVDLGTLEFVLEGKSRPGHFQGVVQVVDRLFEILHPDRAYFGQKDFQQTAVIRKLIAQRHPGILMKVCPIIRESNGLAFSSRNERLTTGEREKAAFIYAALKEMLSDSASLSVEQTAERAKFRLELEEGAELEYLEIVNGHTLEPVNLWTDAPIIAALTVVRFGGVRLLDNILIRGNELF